MKQQKTPLEEAEESLLGKDVWNFAVILMIIKIAISSAEKPLKEEIERLKDILETKAFNKSVLEHLDNKEIKDLKQQLKDKENETTKNPTCR